MWEGWLSYREAPSWTGGRGTGRPHQFPTQASIPSLLLGSTCTQDGLKRSLAENAQCSAPGVSQLLTPLCFRALFAEAVLWGGRVSLHRSGNGQTPLGKTALVSCYQWLWTVKWGDRKLVCIYMAGNVWKIQHSSCSLGLWEFISVWVLLNHHRLFLGWRLLNMSPLQYLQVWNLSARKNIFMILSFL